MQLYAKLLSSSAYVAACASADNARAINEIKKLKMFSECLPAGY